MIRLLIRASPCAHAKLMLAVSSAAEDADDWQVPIEDTVSQGMPMIRLLVLVSPCAHGTSWKAAVADVVRHRELALSITAHAFLRWPVGEVFQGMRQQQAAFQAASASQAGQQCNPTAATELSL